MVRVLAIIIIRKTIYIVTSIHSIEINEPAQLDQREYMWQATRVSLSQLVRVNVATRFVYGPLISNLLGIWAITRFSSEKDQTKPPP